MYYVGLFSMFFSHCVPVSAMISEFLDVFGYSPDQQKLLEETQKKKRVAACFGVWKRIARGEDRKEEKLPEEEPTEFSGSFSCSSMSWIARLCVKLKTIALQRS